MAAPGNSTPTLTPASVSVAAAAAAAIAANANANANGAGAQRPAQSQLTINTILQNLPNLFAMHAKGNLSDLQINQLRQLMHTHFRSVIAASVTSGKPNPLLSLPPAIDPTLPWNGRPPLITREAYAALIATTTKHLEDTLEARRKAAATPPASTPVVGSEADQSQSQAQYQNTNQDQSLMQGAGAGLGPGPGLGQLPTGPIPQRTNTPPTGATPNLGPGSIAPLPNMLGHQTMPAGVQTRPNQGAAQGQHQQQAQSQTQTQQQQKVPPGIFTIQQLRDLMRLTSEARADWLSKDPGRTAIFNLSLKYWSASRQNTVPAPTPIRPQPQTQNSHNATAGPSRATPPPQQAPGQAYPSGGQSAMAIANGNGAVRPSPPPTTIAPSALLTPPIPIAPKASNTESHSPASASGTATVPAMTSTTTATNAAGDTTQAGNQQPAENKEGNKVPSNPGAVSEATTASSDPAVVATSAPPPASAADQPTNPETSDVQTDQANGFSSSNGVTSTEAAPKANTDTDTATASAPPDTQTQTLPQGIPLPSSLANLESTPAFATALPDIKAFALKPPPPPPEPEPIRRKRKFKEIVGELAPGMEMELGVDEILGDILDELLDEGLRGAVRLAKHRGSEKVELKDMSYFVDTAWDTAVPGFDPLGHTHRKLHVPPERERRKGKPAPGGGSGVGAVVPRTAGDDA